MAVDDDGAVVSVYLQGSHVNDEWLERLNGLKNLKALALWRTGVTDAGLFRLKRLTHFDALWLDGREVTDKTLIRLAKLSNLKRLRLSYTRVTDAGLTGLDRMTNLEELWVGGYRHHHVTDVTLSRLAKLANLKRLHFGSTEITDMGIQQAKEALPELEVTKSWPSSYSSHP